MRRIYSGMQPTNTPTLGNYIGAIKQWSSLQKGLLGEPVGPQNPHRHVTDDPTRLMLCSVDLHALTSSPSPAELRTNTRDLVATVLACGLAPENCVLYQQSMVPEHAELAWILGCYTNMGRLNRCTQFKEKSANKSVDSIGVGLYTYPVLMAADILLFNASHVPVGEDQRQHLELTRDLALRFNANVGEEVFDLPTVVYGDHPRVMSLKDGRSKMSKSDPAPGATILVSDTPDMIRAKFRKAKTDGDAGITYDPETRPEISNLIRIYASLRECSVADAITHFEGRNKLEFKEELGETVVAVIEPIRQERERILKDVDVTQILMDGADKARAIASRTIQHAKRAVGCL